MKHCAIKLLFLTLVCLLLNSCATYKDESANRVGQKDLKDYVVKRADLEKKETEDQNREKTDFREVFMDKSVGRIYYIGLLIPMTGKSANIGRQVLDGVTLALYSAKISNVRVLPIDTKSSTIGAKAAAQEAADSKVDIVIGPIFSDETKAASTILQRAGIKAISLSNDISLASDGIYVFGIVPESLMMTTMVFANSIKKKNIGLIMPSNAYGYNMGKKTSKVLHDLDMTEMVTEYYPRDRSLFDAVISRVLFSKTKSYRVGQDGSLYLANRRDRSKRLEGGKDENDLPIVEKTMDAVYLDAKGFDLNALMLEIEKASLRKGGTEVFIGDMLANFDSKLGYKMEGIMFPGVASASINMAENRFEKELGYKPMRISLLAYDALSFVVHLVKKDRNFTKFMYSESGYSGLLGDFRFSKSGIVQRRLGIYMVHNGRPELINNSTIFV